MDTKDQTNEGVLAPTDFSSDDHLSSELCNEIKNPTHTHALKLCNEEAYDACCLMCRSKVYYDYYRCDSCWFVLCKDCVREPLVLDPKRSHEHRLSLVPNSLLVFTCHACGVGGETSPLCLCIPCCFTIHWKCVTLPRVICINRHDHRISYVSSLDYREEWDCQVCRETVDWRYGSYSCSTCFNYVVHSQCATLPSIWDGIELEGVPEEDPEENMPFKVVEEGVIKHFSHEHNLTRLIIDSDDKIYDKNRQCNACIIPVYSDPCYICMHDDDCNFILHEVCANLLKKKRHPSHAHRLTLSTDVKEYHWETFYKCKCCEQKNSGFAYVEGHFYIDVRCASILDGTIHGSHPHPLYFNPNSLKECSGCKIWNSIMIECTRCEDDFSLCFRCATLPDLVKHKYEKHSISLCYGDENPVGVYWCEICEKRLDPTKWFYTCGECCSTLHIHCVLGENPYIRLGAYEDEYVGKFEVVPNNYTFQPNCESCPSRCETILRHEDESRCKAPFLCQGPSVFKSKNLFFCSSLCLNINSGRY